MEKYTNVSDFKNLPCLFRIRYRRRSVKIDILLGKSFCKASLGMNSRCKFYISICLLVPIESYGIRRDEYFYCARKKFILRKTSHLREIAYFCILAALILVVLIKNDLFFKKRLKKAKFSV